ncbi:helix-turn-helix domain-containing protein [Klebsiella michiganensis]|uniref:helix-turn-helix domain-containing protein n=1 Tax=Klebsiella michiganensis TaxID=1134687 RepID=UPI001F153D4E|nr:helix-turn-helix domain-containing protein [Klebsiella michiganensis]
MTDKKDEFCDQDNEFNFGERIALAMAKSHDTISSLVEKTGIPDSTLRGYINKKSEPTGWSQLRKIIKETGVSASWFFGEGGELESEPYVSSVEKDLELLNSLFKYMTPAQRRRVLKRVLASVAHQIDQDAGDDTITEK